MELYLVRHLPTSWNIKGVLQGNADIEIFKISESVDIQIKTNIKDYDLDTKEFEKILISEKIRTLQTAQAYGFKKEDLTIEPLVNELDFGEYQGVNKKELIDQFGPNWYHRVSNTPLKESVINLESNIKEFLSKYSNLSSILIFSHGAFIRGLLNYLEKGNLEEMNMIEVLNNQVIKYDKKI